jgi:hypothetical protein
MRPSSRMQRHASSQQLRYPETIVLCGFVVLQALESSVSCAQQHSR